MAEVVKKTGRYSVTAYYMDSDSKPPQLMELALIVESDRQPARGLRKFFAQEGIALPKATTFEVEKIDEGEYYMDMDQFKAAAQFRTVVKEG